MKLLISLLLYFTSLATFAERPQSGSDLVTGKPIVFGTGTKGEVLVFLSAKCPCSNSHLPELRKLANEYTDFQFVGIHANANEPVALSKEYFIKQDLPFPILQDDHAKWADEFKANKTPHAFLLSSHGEILFRGGVTSSHNAANADRFYLREALEDVDHGRTVRTKDARTLGCAISRKEL